MDSRLLKICCAALAVGCTVLIVVGILCAS